MASVSRSIAKAAKRACIIEVTSHPKPGNVSIFSSHRDLRYEHFVSAARAIEEPIKKLIERTLKAKKSRKPEKIGLGRAIYECAEASFAACGNRNVNSGIILLLVPLAAGFALNQRDPQAGAVRAVNSTTPEDSVNFYKAMRLLKPRLETRENEKYDIYDEKSDGKLLRYGVNFPKLFRLTDDLIGSEVAGGFERTYEAAEYLGGVFEKMEKLNPSVCQTYLYSLSKHRDTHAARQAGEEKAERIMKRAQRILKKGGVLEREGLMETAKFDRELKAQGVNPGASADLVCGAIFLCLLRDELGKE
ncbi:2-(5''-triphosphoribosyl)-3'-dephosphocoenzyme-A synthase [Candidatus Gugararchaeum adminiculabundum]|nr:2-(5''-triphosphoribosyl)-3'-dephosphocoenzyme-A synthase [Candidatus Gugararchaeum adminiculabundum]